MNSLTEENYLKAIFNLQTEKNKVTVNELSRYLNIKMSSVNSMMKKFVQKNWVIAENYKPIILTEQGKKEAALIVRKHRLIEMFLVKKMEFGWEHVHEIAEQLEHIHSDIFFDRMDSLLNHPKIDPHGKPIPDKDGNIIEKDFKKLSECQVGETIVIAAVTVDDLDFLHFLNSKNIQLREQVKILSIEKFDQSMSVEVHQKEITLSKMVCDRLLIER